MDKNKEELNEVEHDSASLKDYEIEVEEPAKKGFFANIIDKIKGNNSQKLLNSGNETFQKTNRSISSMWTIASLRRVVMDKLENLNRSLFRSPEAVDQSNITTQVIGKNDAKKEELSQEAEKTTFEPIIPIAKSAAARATVIVPSPVKSGIINNSKSAKDVREEIEAAQGLQAEEFEVSDEFTLEYEKDSLNIDELTAGDVINNTTKNVNPPTIEVGEIKVEEKPKKQQERNGDDDRDL